MPDPTPAPAERIFEIQFQAIREIATKLEDRIGRLETRLTLILILLASNVLGISLENAKAMLTHLGT